MLVSSDVLRHDLTKELEKYVNNPKFLREVRKTATLIYHMPSDVSSDLLSLRKSLDEANDYKLFVLLDCIDRQGAGLRRVEKYFTPNEIAEYGRSVYEEEKIKFPLEFPMIQVSDDQWIGKITAQELFKLKNASLINYNENEQRRMKHIIKGDIEYYKIFLNDKAVSEIRRLYETESYVSNTITLNLPEDARKHYEKDEYKLIIEYTSHFDILDGYHRYIALSKEIFTNNTFDYPMELRIVQFDSTKANRFIWQEDQKTKMRKIDSDALNQSEVATRVTNKLNSSSDLAGCITNNKANGKILVDKSEFIQAVKIIYDTRFIPVKDETQKTIEISKDLLEKINGVIFEYPDIIKKDWGKAKIIGFIAACHEYDNPGEIYDATNWVEEFLGKKENGYLLRGLLSKKFANIIITDMKGR